MVELVDRFRPRMTQQCLLGYAGSRSARSLSSIGGLIFNYYDQRYDGLLSHDSLQGSHSYSIDPHTSVGSSLQREELSYFETIYMALA